MSFADSRSRRGAIFTTGIYSLNRQKEQRNANP
jgi:hypothetical protein